MEAKSSISSFRDAGTSASPSVEYSTLTYRWNASLAHVVGKKRSFRREDTLLSVQSRAFSRKRTQSGLVRLLGFTLSLPTKAFVFLFESALC